MTIMASLMVFFIQGGIWNIMNGLAGILSIVTISGWYGIFIGKDKNKDMLWPDQLWFWIIAYDLWNFAYVYNCIPDHSFYSGAVLLLSCTIPAFFIKKGAWLQHRAQTLALWAMFSLTMPYFADTSIFAVKSSHSTTALIAVSALALASNAAVFIYQSDESSSLNSIHLRMKSSQTLMHTRKLLKRTSRLLNGSKSDKSKSVA